MGESGAHGAWWDVLEQDEITDLEFPHGHHLHWPKLDIDLPLDIIRDPDKYKLVSQVEHPSGGFFVRRLRRFAQI